MFAKSIPDLRDGKLAEAGVAVNNTGFMKESDNPKLSKEQRMEIFFGRLRRALAVATFDEAYQLLCQTLNAVEDEHSGVPANPSMWRDDERLYPPQDDKARAVESVPGVTVFRSRLHKTFIATNGAILIWDLSTRRSVLSKKGKDGKEVPKEATK
jgi:hypothetical protein